VANYLDSLIDRIEDDALRADLIREIRGLRNRKDFGLVFERHLPETVRLYSHPVKAGATVQERADNDGPLWTVRKVTKAKATIERREGTETISEVMPADDLVVVRRFGDAIYPGLTSLGRIEGGGDDRPWHAVIEAENYHALETLLYAYEGKIDCIYIDPPYNTGARDWKYNNDYVDRNDSWRHSKWLSMMERRLLIAKRLLRPGSTLVVTIDENESHRLAVLLAQVFPDADIQMVTAVINRAGSPRPNRLTRVEEYIYFVFIGDGSAACGWTTNLLNDSADGAEMPTVWFSAIRVGSRKALRSYYKETALFYPVLIDAETGAFHSVGDPLPMDQHPDDFTPPAGTVPIWPLSNGREQTWRFARESMIEYFAKGTARLGRRDAATGLRPVTYLRPGTLQAIEDGLFKIVGRSEEGAVELALGDEERAIPPASVWNMTSHYARDHGSKLLAKFIPGRDFDYPKSLYAVEDTLRVAVGEKPDAVVLDFFAGSGTTAHAVARLNRQDGGSRQCIVVTNNETSEGESQGLRSAGHQPGDPEWERRGVYQYVTAPRIAAAVTGRTPEGEPVKGEYAFTDEFPMADGFEENVEFFRLGYLDRDQVSLGRAFEAVAPLLWLKAGGVGPRVEKITKPWALPEGAVYGVLFDPQQWASFTHAVAERGDEVRHAFVVTDSTSVYQQVIAELPPGMATTMLYEDYLSTFTINTGGRS
jgi:adenine-specific DNA-methyltransferase